MFIHYLFFRFRHLNHTSVNMNKMTYRAIDFVEEQIEFIEKLKTIINYHKYMTELTFGEKLVRLNHKGTTPSDSCKREYAAIIDKIHDLRTNSENVDQKRWYSLAITDLEQSCMWAVKALTNELHDGQ